MDQLEAYKQIQLLRQELARWKITKFDKEKLRSWRSNNPEHFSSNSSFYNESHLHAPIIGYIIELVRHLQEYRSQLQPGPFLNTYENLKRDIQYLIESNIERLPQTGYYIRAQMHEKINRRVVANKTWRELARQNCVVVKNRFIISAQYLKTSKDEVELYAVTFLTTTNYEQVQSGFMAKCGRVISTGRTQGGALGGVKRRVFHKVSEVLT